MIPVFGVRTAIIVLFPENQASDGDKIVDVRYQNVAFGVEGVAAPGHAADVSGNHERSLQARGSKDSFVAKVLDVIATRLAIFGGRSEERRVGRGGRSGWWG